jgi:hypothetical protein
MVIMDEKSPLIYLVTIIMSWILFGKERKGSKAAWEFKMEGLTMD